jgi:flavin-dependent dehydrogenase
MNTSFWDTIVIGGGPAGSTAAGLLAKKVLVLERDKFPRFHIGESLIPFGNDVLNELGVWNKLEQAGFMPKLGAEFTLGNGAGMQRLLFRDSLEARYAQTFQVERARFDHLLLNHAEEQGTQVIYSAKVTQVRVDENGAKIAYDHVGKTHHAIARWIVDASGRISVVGNALKVPKTDLNMPKRMAVFSHFKNVYRNPGEASGHITIVRLENAWCWFIPLDAEKTSVGLVQILDAFKTQGVSPQESFENAIRRHAELRYRLKNAERLEEFRVEGDYTFRHLQAAGPRWLLAGDAAGFIDPIFSSGVMVALRSSQLAAHAILKADASNRALSGSEQRAYTRGVKKMTSVFLAMIRMFYDRNSFEVFMSSDTRFDTPRAVLNLVAGNTQLSWSLQWRVWLFYTMCWLQRYRKIAPGLSFHEMTHSAEAITT